ncbi:MAG: HAMP domain-containing sensor histidine kinase, partial [Cyanobacteria bacterium J06621_11]
PSQHPTLGTGNEQSLGIHSTLSALPLYSFTVNGDCSIRDLIDHFIKSPNLPGVIVTNLVSETQKINLLSRQQCLNCLLHTAQIPHFIDSPVRVLLKQTLEQAQHKPLILSSDTAILNAAKRALKRPLSQQSQPVLVQEKTEECQLLDAHVLNVAHWQVRGIEMQIRYERLQMQILESEKMASLGRLVDGVAHEILDPVSFIWGNLSYIANYAKQQHELITAYEAALPNPPAEILDLQEEIELDYLRSDLPAAIKSARGGAHRLRQLATSLQNFCHIDAVHPRPTDLNTLIDSTLRLLKSRLTTPITIEHSYGKLPPVPCFSGQLSQVFMNIFTSTIDSLLSQVQLYDHDGPNADASPKPLKITVTTCVCADQHLLTGAPEESRWVSVIISDNGPGIPPETKAQILDSFSTKHQHRKETGLAMSYRIITAKHGGKFWLRSVHASEETLPEEKQTTGTEFEILLPLTVIE